MADITALPPKNWRKEHSYPIFGIISIGMWVGLGLLGLALKIL